jgi:hypothetical protein
MRSKLSALLAALALATVACSGSGSPADNDLQALPTTTRNSCPRARGASRALQLDMPDPGGFYTRHVPVEGWADAAPGDVVDVKVTGARGGLLGSSQFQVGDDLRNGRHRVEGIIVVQIIPEKISACLAVGAAGRFMYIPILVGGANP